MPNAPKYDRRTVNEMLGRALLVPVALAATTGMAYARDHSNYPTAAPRTVEPAHYAQYPDSLVQLLNAKDLVIRDGPDEPEYSRGPIRRKNGTFDAHVRNGDYPGPDTTFGEGMPVVGLSKGKVAYSDKKPKSGNLIIYDAGVYAISDAHLMNRAVEAGDDVTRLRVLGFVGKTGTGAKNTVHVHTNLYGVGPFKDLDFKMQEYGARYEFFERFPMDANTFTPDGNLLHKSPWDFKTDFDNEYWEHVDRVEQSLDRFMVDYRDTELGRIVINDRLSGMDLVTTINTAWFFYEEHRKERSPEILAIEEVWDLVKFAGEKIVLTSPYLNHNDPNVIAAAFAYEENDDPKIKRAIIENMGRFLSSTKLEEMIHQI